MHLDRRAGGLLRAFDGRELGGGAGKTPVRQAAVERGGGVAHGQARVVHAHPGVGELVLDGLVAADGLAELHALAGVGAGEVECGLRDADEFRRQRDAVGRAHAGT
ncbi:hypothetical protein D3C72_2293470 [compost metagenome]